MANEYRIVNGATAGTGVDWSDAIPTMTVDNMNAGGALTIGTPGTVAVVWVATETKAEVLRALENAKLKVFEHFSAT